MVKAKPLKETEVLAKITLPFVEPEIGTVIGSRFAAIHSNPPALKPEDSPAITIHSYGKGCAVWAAAPAECSNEKVNGELVLALLKRVLHGPYRFEANTHTAVEMVLFEQPEKNRMLAGLLNLQKQLPQVQVGATVRVQVPVKSKVKRILHLPDLAKVRFEKVGHYVQFYAKPFDTLAMFLIEITNGGFNV